MFSQIGWGKISEVLANRGLYRVTFPAKGDLVSQPLPRASFNTLANKDEVHFDVNEHVVCAMDDHYENGVILGAIYDAGNLPIAGNKDKRRTTYSDGSYVEFDRAAKKLTVSCEGDVEITKSTNTKITASQNVELNAASVIKLNGTSNNGIVKAAVVKNKLATLEDDANKMRSLVAALAAANAAPGGSVTAVTIGTLYALFSGVTYPSVPFTPTTAAELRNDTVKH